MEQPVFQGLGSENAVPGIADLITPVSTEVTEAQSLVDDSGERMDLAKLPSEQQPEVIDAEEVEFDVFLKELGIERDGKKKKGEGDISLSQMHDILRRSFATGDPEKDIRLYNSLKRIAKLLTYEGVAKAEINKVLAGG